MDVITLRNIASFA